MADVDVRIEFNEAGFDQVLNSAGVVAMLDSIASDAVSRGHGVLHKRRFTANLFKWGSARPAFAVWTHSKTREDAAVDRKILEGAV